MNITTDGLIDMLHAVKPRDRGTGKFLATAEAILMIRRLRDGGGNYVSVPTCQGPANLLGHALEEVPPSHPSLRTGAGIAFVTKRALPKDPTP